MKQVAKFIALAAGGMLLLHSVPTIGSIEMRLVWRATIALTVATLLLLDGRLRLTRLAIQKLNDLSTRQRRYIAWSVFALSAIYFVASALICKRAFHPTWHDDQMHAVQARLLSIGRLWLPPQPMHEFFDTFHIFMTPVYAPIHFPGTAILNVSGVWLHLPAGVIPIVLIAASCAIGFLLLSEVLSGIAGIGCVAFLWASPDARMLATMSTSHNAMIFLGVLSLWLFVQWQKERTLGWSVALGLVVGLAGITRPVDAIAYAMPIGIGVLIRSYQGSPRRWRNIPVMIACAIPFLSLQLAFDHAVTGSWLNPPYAHYNDLFHPFSTYASARLADLDARAVHVSDLPQKQLYYESFILPYARLAAHVGMMDRLWNDRLPLTFSTDLPTAVLLLFVPLGLLGFRSVNRFVVGAPALLFIVFYVPNVFYFPHYPPVVLISLAAITFCGIDLCSELVFKQLSLLRPFLYTAALMAAACEMTPFSFLNGSEYSTDLFKATDFVYESLPKLVEQPALVFCPLNPRGINVHDEPVYNPTTAYIDDAKIVLAQSLGQRNIELIKHYHDIGQNRHVYKFDRLGLKVRYAGTVDQLVMDSSPTTQPATMPNVAR